MFTWYKCKVKIVKGVLVFNSGWYRMHFHSKYKVINLNGCREEKKKFLRKFEIDEIEVFFNCLKCRDKRTAIWNLVANVKIKYEWNLIKYVCVNINVITFVIYNL